MVNTASRDASSCALAGGGGGNGAMSVLLLLWRRTPVRHSPRCTACSCDMLLLYLLQQAGQHNHAPCRRMRARRRRRRERIAPAPPQLDSGALRGDSRSTGRSSSKRRVWHRYAPGSQSSWALPYGTFAALAWRGFTRNGSSWRPPLPSPQKQPLCWSVFAPASVVWMPTRGVHLCAHTCARSSLALLACVDTAGQCSHCPHMEK